MTIFSYAGAPAAPAAPAWATQFAALDNLVGAWEFPNARMLQTDGAISGVTSFAQSAGRDPVTFSAGIGAEPVLGARDGIACAEFSDGSEMTAPGGLFAAPATIFVAFHVAPGQLNGAIFGDFSDLGGRMAIELAGARDDGVEIRARTSASNGSRDHAVKFGWHCAAIQIDGAGEMRALFDGGIPASSSGATVDFNLFNIGFGGFSGGIRFLAAFDAAVIGQPQMDLCNEYWRWLRGAAY